MAVEPWFQLFPTAGAFVFAGLAAGVLMRRASLGGQAVDWTFAFLFGALAFFAALAAGVADWSPPADFAVAYSGAAAGVAFLAAFSGLFQRYARGTIGAPGFRWTLRACAFGLEGFAWGGLAAAPPTMGDGVPESWVAVPVAASVVALLPIALLAARYALPRAGLPNTLQLFLGAALVGAGLVVLSLGDTLMGSALGMVGGGILYSGTAAVAALAPAAASPALRPLVEEGAPSRPRKGPGVKVRIPKGGAVRVSSFRDDEPGTDESD